MLNKERSLTEIASNMRSLGNMLVPYTYPKSFSSLIDGDLDIFREREVYIDGYSIMIYYQKSDYDYYLLETLQVYNKVGPFLPFCVLVKIAIAFLGSTNLSLVEVFKDNRKLYCWSIAMDSEGFPVELPYEADGENCTFEGINYFYINPSYVNFY